MNEHITEAVTALTAREAYYARCGRYYDGKHDLAFATDKFRNTFGSLFREFALNMCPAVCDSLRDKLRLTGFASDGRGDAASSRRVEEMALRAFRQSRLTLLAAEIHAEALIYGDAYMMVWPDNSGHPRFYANRAANCTVIYSDDEPGVAVRAAKYWATKERHLRLNLFYPDRIEKYVTAAAAESLTPHAEDFRPLDEDSVVPNQYGILPVFHFANNARVGENGRSELDAVIPIQDGLNKSMLDMLVAMEFSAYRQRWAAGIEVEIDNEGKPVAPFKAGVDHLWISQNPDARFGDFATANLEQFLRVKDSFRSDIACVTGVPLHYFLASSARSFATGEALRNAERRFLAKVRDRQEAFGQIWSDAMGFALKIAGIDAPVRPRWDEASPLSEKERRENALLSKALGVSDEQALAEIGYSPAAAAAANDD